MLYNGILDKKLFSLQERLTELKSWPIGNYEEFKNNSILRNAVERALQVSIEIMIDISERILAIEEIAPGETSAENMKALQGIGGIKSFERYVKMIQFRNFIVHRYEKVNPEIVYDISKNSLNDFQAFINEITTFIRNRNESKPS